MSKVVSEGIEVPSTVCFSPLVPPTQVQPIRTRPARSFGNVVPADVLQPLVFGPPTCHRPRRGVPSGCEIQEKTSKACRGREDREQRVNPLLAVYQLP